MHIGAIYLSNGESIRYSVNAVLETIETNSPNWNTMYFLLGVGRILSQTLNCTGIHGFSFIEGNCLILVLVMADESKLDRLSNDSSGKLVYLYN